MAQRARSAAEGAQRRVPEEEPCSRKRETIDPDRYLDASFAPYLRFVDYSPIFAGHRAGPPLETREMTAPAGICEYRKIEMGSIWERHFRVSQAHAELMLGKPILDSTYEAIFGLRVQFGLRRFVDGTDVAKER